VCACVRARVCACVHVRACMCVCVYVQFHSPFMFLQGIFVNVIVQLLMSPRPPVRESQRDYASAISRTSISRNDKNRTVTKEMLSLCHQTRDELGPPGPSLGLNSITCFYPDKWQDEEMHALWSGFVALITPSPHNRRSVMIAVAAASAAVTLH
jgi:hypothetical protein